MSDKKTGGPAFPVRQVVIDKGMTLRDYFAGQALAGFYSGYIGNDQMPEMGFESIAKEMYEMADAMLKERDK